MTKEEKDLFNQAFDIFDQLDEAGKHAVAAVFLDTPETGKDSPYHREFKRRGYAKPGGEA